MKRLDHINLAWDIGTSPTRRLRNSSATEFGITTVYNSAAAFSRDKLQLLILLSNDGLYGKLFRQLEADGSDGQVLVEAARGVDSHFNSTFLQSLKR